MRYLNCISRYLETSDGFIEESHLGPDVLQLPILVPKMNAAKTGSQESVRTPLYNSYIEKVESYKECVTVEPFEGLFTGFCGGVETLGMPHHATSR